VRKKASPFAEVIYVVRAVDDYSNGAALKLV
jgi:hypothetical protein